MRLFLLLIPFLIAACNKPDPNPELRDEIYHELNNQLAAATHALSEEEKNLEGFQSKLKEVTPQTGQIKFAQKRVFDSENKIDHLKQEKAWLELRISERLADTKKNYMKAFKAGKDWPDPKEYEEFVATTKLRKAKREWDSKARIEATTPKKPKGEKAEGEVGEKKKE
jgi:hypothetical protein